MPMQNFLWVVLGGGLGAALRHGFSKTAYWLLGKGFPWGTLAANLVGCFLIGFLWATANRFSFPPNARLFIFTGTIGALTTFSTYGLESFMLLHEGRYAAGITNIAVHNLLGIGLVVLGFACAELLLEGSLSGVLIGTET